MADTNGNKEKKKKNKSPGDESAKPSKGDEKKSKSKDGQGSSKPVDNPSSLPMESKGTDSILQDFPDIGKEKKNEEDGIRRPMKWHPDEIHCDKLCLKCLKINYYWPPRLRPPTPPDKDPHLIYPGDVDLTFKPARGDILIVHPRGLGLDPKPSPEELWWKSKRVGGGFCICLDGDKKFKFEKGDLILRIGSYVEGGIEAQLENYEQLLEGNKQPKKGKQNPKPKKIADPPQLDSVTYKPYDKVELYRCSGFEILTEDKPLEEDALEAELKRVFKSNTNYEFSLGKNGNPDNSNPRITSPEPGIGKGTMKQNPGLAVDNLKNTSTDKTLKPSIDPESKPSSTAENLARNYVTSRDLQKNQGSQNHLEGLEAQEMAPKEEKPSKIKLLWTFLGSQAKLGIDDRTVQVTDPRCPGLGCFYHPYLNLGNHCKKQEHIHVPYLGEILIPEGVWFDKFNHRKNAWRSMVEWYVPLTPSLLSPLEGAAGLPGDQAPGEEASNSEIDKKQKINSKKKGEGDKDNKAGDKSKVGMGKGSAKEDSKKKEDGLVADKGVKVGKVKDIVQSAEPNSSQGLEKADKAVQVPDDLEQVAKVENLDSQIMPINWNNEPTLGTIVLRPLAGRKLEDEKTPVEEWKWPRKNKVWGSVEMYIVEPRLEPGTNDLDWVFWGRSDRICDTSQPPPQLGAKLKFLHPKDATVKIPRNHKDLGEDSPQVKTNDASELPKEDGSRGGAKLKEEVGKQNKDAPKIK